MIAEIREIYVRKDEIESNWEQGGAGKDLGGSEVDSAELDGEF
jgi:hypothetical protein